MKVLVIYGGTSSEREVSLHSGKNVHAALERSGHTVTLLDPINDPSYEHLADRVHGIDVVFPVLHGKNGEDGQLQQILERLGVPFVGSGAAVSRNCFDKLQTLNILQAAQLPVPDTDVVTYDQLPDHRLTQQPFVLKPQDEGSSVDTYLIRDPAAFNPADYRAAFDKRGSLLIETLVSGIELTVPVLGDTALPVIEIIPPEGGEFDYENKYNGQTQELCPPQHIPADVQAQAQRLAEAAHRTMACRHMSRTDMIWATTGELVILEINTLPGMTAESLYPKAAKAAGMSIEQLVDLLVTMAVNTEPVRA